MSDNNFGTSKEERDDKYYDQLGRFRTLSMFYETTYGKQGDHWSPYTLKERDLTDESGTRISLKRAYLEMEDPTEYLFANEFFDCWRHWEAVCNSPQIKSHIEQWREELELKLRAKGVRKMIQDVENNKASFQGQKWLAEKGFIEKKAGRPSKATVEAEKKKQARLHDEFAEDTLKLLKK